MQIVRLGIEGMLLSMLVRCFYFCFSITGTRQAVADSMQNLYQVSKDYEQARRKKEQKLRWEEGNQEKQHILYRLDIMLLQSGLKRKFSFLSTELYVCGTLFLMTGVFFVTQFFVKQYFVSIAAFLSIGLLSFLSLDFLNGLNYQRIEKEIITFINLLENYSKTNDDILSIFGKISPYLEEPLRTLVEECYLEGMTLGRTSEAFRHLQMYTSHEKFKNLIQNLEICSRHEANYEEIIRDSRDMLQGYIRIQREKKTLQSNAKAEMVMILMCCALLFYMMDGFMRLSFPEVLAKTMIGWGLLIYCTVIILCILWSICRVSRGNSI